MLVAGCARLWLRPLAQWLLVCVLCSIWGGVIYGLAPDAGVALSQDGNAAGVVDLAVFGASHLWIKEPGFDPEGIVSTLTAIATVSIGLAVGRVFVREGDARGRLTRLQLLGVVLWSLGLLLSHYIPINKSLWPPSYVFFTAGIGTLVLAATYWCVDLLHLRKPFFAFEALCRNARVLFVGPQSWPGV